MNKNKTYIIILMTVLILTFILFLIPTKTYAKGIVDAGQGAADTIIESSGSGTSGSAVIDPGDFEPPALTDEDTDIVTDKTSVITNFIGVLGIIVSVIALILIGIKFMIGSVEEKADYKKSMIPYLIGVFVFFATTQLLSIIIKIVEGLNI